LPAVGLNAFGTLCLKQAVRGSEQLGVLCVALNSGGQANRSEHLVEGVADMLEFVVQFVAVMLEIPMAGAIGWGVGSGSVFWSGG
jgi:hypothetical protein